MNHLEKRANNGSPRKVRFWPLLGIVLAADVLLVLAYTLIVPGFSGRAFSDALCVSALLLGAATAIPVLLDTGRSFGVGARMGDGEVMRHVVLQKERQRREQGMVITFALAAAVLILAIASFLIGLAGP